MQRRDLMDAAAVLCFLQQLLCFGNRNRPSLACVVEHVTDMTHEDAQSFIQVTAALSHHAPDTPALTGCYAQMPVVIFDIFADALIVNLLRFGRDCTFYRNYTHNAGTHRSIRCMLNLAGGCMLMKRVGNFRVSLAEFFVDEKKLKNSRRIGRQQIDLHTYFF